MEKTLQIWDFLLVIAHLAVIVFNLFAWIFPKTRRWHLIVAALTLGSWLLLGIWYGLGYCFLTDWHWQVKRKLGETNLPDSFVKYFADRYTPFTLSAGVVDGLTVGAFAVAIACSLYVNFARK
jgi:hypothetical protein